MECSIVESHRRLKGAEHDTREFLKELAETKRSWEITKDGNLRSHGLCPIEAIHRKYYPRSPIWMCVSRKGEKLGLNENFILRIIHAADWFLRYLPLRQNKDLRVKLLKACGVKEGKGGGDA